MRLRPYQVQAVQSALTALIKPDPVLIVASTGAGKTLVFIELVKRIVEKYGVRVAILMGRNNLVEQNARRMREVLPDTCVWSSGQGEKSIGQVTVVSIHSADTLTIPDLKLIIVDEAHNLSEGRYMSFIRRHAAARVIGFTATPWTGSYPIYGADKFFPRVSYQVGLKSLIKDGHLVPPVIRGGRHAWDTANLDVRGGDYVLSQLTKLVSDKGKVSEQVSDALSRLQDRRHVVWTCVSIEHAESVADELSKRGEAVAVVHSKVRDADYALRCFERGHCRHAVSVMMLSEGVDIPCVDAIILMRATKSPTLMVQTIGRGLRPFLGKRDCVVLDYGRVIENCGPIDAPYIRDPSTKRTRGQVFQPTIRLCSGCLIYLPHDTVTCPDCGHIEQTVVDRMKALERQAQLAKIMSDSEPEEYGCRGIAISRYKSKKGNDCIRLRFDLIGRISPAFIYCTEHPRSWREFKDKFYKITPFTFDSWRELYDCLDCLDEFDIPSKVIVQTVGGFESVVRVYT
jgi:DNA repair protein RadD